MKRLYIFLFILISFARLSAFETISAYEGTRFMLGFMQNENYVQQSTGMLLQIFITSRFNTNVTIAVPTYPIQNFFINRDSVFTVNIDPNFEMWRSEVPLLNSFEVTSDLPITISAYSSQWKTTDSYTAIPIDKWGTEYVVMSQPNDQYTVQPMTPPADSARLAFPRSSEFMVIASEDSTVIEFRPRAITQNLKQTFRHYKETLNKGECYLVKSYPTQRGTGELTGTIVKSNKPIGFLSGHVRSAVPQFLSEQWDSKNHLIEMLQPVKSWGRKFVTVPLLPYSFMPYGDMIKLIGYYPETNVTCKTPSGFKSYVIRDSGDFVVLPNIAEVCIWQSDKPIQIGQYLMHSGNSLDNGNYDPSMVVVPPIEQFVQRVLFNTPGNPDLNPYQFDYHYICLIAESSSLNSLTLDGQLVTDLGPIITQRISGTNYHYVRLRVNKGRHELICQNGGFSGVLYGIGEADAYSHIIGSSIANPYEQDTIPPIIDLKYKCGTVTGYAFERVDRFNTGLDYCQVILDSTYNYSWKDMTISDSTTYVDILAQVIDITQDARFVIDIRDKYGNGKRYRFFYSKLDVEIPKVIEYFDVDSKDSVCQKFFLRNNSKDTVILKSVNYTIPDSRLIFTLGKKLPVKLAPGDTLKGTICLEPNGDTTTITTKLAFLFDCDLLSTVPIKARLISYELRPLGHDFGLVRIGDTVCDKIGIANFGNSEIILDSIQFDSNYSIFSLDTIGIFPVTINSGDTLFLKVCFKPDSVKNYTLSYFWKNTKVNNLRSVVTGTGGAPNFDSIMIDWGKRRLSTKNDTTFWLKNIGNYPAYIKFKQIEVLSEEFNRNEIMGINYRLSPGDSVMISTSYMPVNQGIAFFSASLETDWTLHKPILVELVGIGSLPSIKTTDIDFGTLFVNQSKDTFGFFAQSYGNESLSIDNIYLISPDLGDFSGDLSIYNNFVADSGMDLGCLFNFNPKIVGYQERVFGIIHDALPNYERDTSYFKLMGRALPNDTVEYSVNLWADGSLPICRTSVLHYEFQNLGNVDMFINAIKLMPSGLTANWVVAPIYPVNVPVLGKVKFDINAKPFEKANVMLEVETMGNANSMNKDTIYDIRKLNLIVDGARVALNSPVPFKSSPGDTVNLIISGSFSNKIEDPVTFKITGKLNLLSYMISTKEPLLQLDDNGNISYVKCTVIQTKDGFEINPEQELVIGSDNIKWSVTLKLFTFLNDERNPVIEITAQTDKCYDSDNKKLITEIGEVCVLNMRAVIASERTLEVLLTPNPVSDRLEAEIKTMAQTEAEITVFDQLGKKSFHNEKIFLNKGNNSRIFEFSSLTNGVYLLNISTPYINKSIIFIILK